MAQQPASTSTVFGIGIASCAHWLSLPNKVEEGNAWLLGYWSGENSMNPRNHKVGDSTDGDALIAEVKKICQAEPSTTFANAVDRVYGRFEFQGK
jgi:hypothetical protein